jgi:hypothetical protein
MSRKEFIAFTDMDDVEVTTAVEVSHLDDVAVVVGGTFSATWKLQVSPDGTLWVDHATITGKTAAFAGTVGYPVKQVRLSCTAFSSGTIEGFATGVNPELKN